MAAGPHAHWDGHSLLRLLQRHGIRYFVPVKATRRPDAVIFQQLLFMPISKNLMLGSKMARDMQMLLLWGPQPRGDTVETCPASRITSRCPDRSAPPSHKRRLDKPPSAATATAPSRAHSPTWQAARPARQPPPAATPTLRQPRARHAQTRVPWEGPRRAGPRPHLSSCRTRRSSCSRMAFSSLLSGLRPPLLLQQQQ